MAAQSEQNPTVFIVDDDAAIRFAMQALMDSVNLEHEIFASGDEFLEKVNEQRPGCLVLDIRMPGLGGQALGKLGASVQNLPGSEVYQALASGQIDGAEWIGPFADERLGFQEVTNIYYTAGFHEPGSGLIASMNLDVWNELSPKLQAIVANAARAANSVQLSQTLAENGAALQRLKNLCWRFHVSSMLAP